MNTLDRLSEILGRPLHSSVQPCASKKGALCVVVSRTGQPLRGIEEASISITGATPGSASSDATGIAEFNGLEPGEYTMRLSLAGSRYARWRVEPHSARTVISGGVVSVLEVQVTPTGILSVDIRYEGGGPVVEKADARITGVVSFDTSIERGHHMSQLIPCGMYKVAVGLTLQGTRLSLPGCEVLVPEDGKGLAQFIVPELSWIEIELVGKNGKALSDEEYAIIAPNGQEFRGRTDLKGVARLNGIVSGQCEIRFPRLDGAAVSHIL